MTGFQNNSQNDPFIEAPTLRSNSEQLALLSQSQGMVTREFDRFRQGVSVRSDYDRYLGTLPKFRGDKEDFSFITNIVTYGQAREFTPEPKFEDLAVFDPVTYIQSSLELAYPIILDNATLLDPERVGGFIEPLDLPARDLIRAEGRDSAHRVRGIVSRGNEDSFGKSDQISQFFENLDNEPTPPGSAFYDSSGIIGSQGAYISLPGRSPDKEVPLTPFDESRALNETLLSGTISNKEILNARLQMTGTATENYVPFGLKSAGTGFTYGDSSFGVDSLAFGGLKR